MTNQLHENSNRVKLMKEIDSSTYFRIFITLHQVFEALPVVVTLSNGKRQVLIDGMTTILHGGMTMTTDGMKDHRTSLFAYSVGFDVEGREIDGEGDRLLLEGTGIGEIAMVSREELQIGLNRSYTRATERPVS